MLDSLACTDGAIGATAQGWLVRALSLGDVARILEPVLLLLLEPKTQRASIHCLKQQSSTGEHAARRPGQLSVPGAGRAGPQLPGAAARHLDLPGGFATFRRYEGTLWGLLRFKNQMNQHLEMLGGGFVVFTEKHDFFILNRKMLVTHVPINIAGSWFFC